MPVGLCLVFFLAWLSRYLNKMFLMIGALCLVRPRCLFGIVLCMTSSVYSSLFESLGLWIQCFLWLSRCSLAFLAFLELCWVWLVLHICCFEPGLLNKMFLMIVAIFVVILCCVWNCVEYGFPCRFLHWEPGPLNKVPLLVGLCLVISRFSTLCAE